MGPPMGPPPGMAPPPGEGPPMPGMGAPQAPEMDPNVPLPTPKDMIVEQIRVMREQMGDDVVREELANFDDDMIEQLREWQTEDAYAASILDEVMPPDTEDPDYPSWFDQPEKPTRSEVESIATYDWDFWVDVREGIKEDLEFFHQDVGSAYNDFDKQRDQLYHDDALSVDCNSIVAKIAAKDLTFQFNALDSAHAQDAQKAEDAVAYWFDGVNRRHMRSGHHSTKRDVALSMMLGSYACAYTALNLRDNEMPFSFGMADPATVVPTWDDYGLVRVTRKYQDTVANVISCFKLKGEKKRELLRKRKDDTGDETPEGKRLTEWVEVVTYDDRWWSCAIADGIEIVPTIAHRYGFVPWVIKGLELGEPMFLSGLVGDQAPVAGIRGGDSRIHRKHVSFFHFRKHQHMQKEAILSKMFSLWKMVDKPGWFWIYDEFSKNNGVPKPGTGLITPIQKDHEDLRQMMDAVNPQIFGTLIQAHVNGEQRSRMSLASLGATDDANTSGNAINTMTDQGTHIIDPIQTSVESFFTELGEMWLMMWRDWGHLYQGNFDEYGATNVPYLSRRAWREADSSFVLTPEVVKRCGVRIKAQFTEMSLSSLTPMANALGMLKQLGWMPNSKALSMLGFANPNDIVEEVEYDQTRGDPTIQKLVRYQRLKEFDPELAEEYREGEIRKTQPPPMDPSMMMGPGPMAPPPGGPQMVNPQGGLDPNSSAMNLAALGQGPYMPTGRPPGEMGGFGGEVPPVGPDGQPPFGI